MKPLQISRQTFRRYILGRQGLWPGRRWAGKAGAHEALRAIEAVQIDPLSPVGRNHDLTLWGRVLDYQMSHLDALAHDERQCFDYGNLLFYWPMEELPYWRIVMDRWRQHPRYRTFAAENGALLDEVRAELRGRGPLGNRDFKDRVRVESYRARKDSGLALFYLWLTGELMTHHRRGGERILYFRDEIAPAAYNYSASVVEAEAFFARKVFSYLGLATEAFWASWLSLLGRRTERDEAKLLLQRLLDEGAIASVVVEGDRTLHYTTADGLPLLAELEAGRVPAAWQPLDTTTEEEVTFLGPLDIVSARGRAKKVFDFEYVWEVYKPEAARRWGYYTLPVLYGDQLVARIDPKFDRKAKILEVNGLWLDQAEMGSDPAFIQALGRGLRRLARFAGAKKVDLKAVIPTGLRRTLRSSVTSLPDNP